MGSACCRSTDLGSCPPWNVPLAWAHGCYAGASLGCVWATCHALLQFHTLRHDCLQGGCKCVFSGCSSDLATEVLAPRLLQATFGPLNCLLAFSQGLAVTAFVQFGASQLHPYASLSCRFTNPPKTPAGKNPPPVCVKCVPLFGWWHVPVFADGVLAAWFSNQCHCLLQGSGKKRGACASPSPLLQCALAQPELF